MRYDRSYLAVVLDRSGSMAGCRQATISGFNEFLAQQQAEPEQARLYLAQFDDQYELVYDKPLNLAQKLTEDTYVPRGMTALFDAMGKTINDLGKKLSEIPESERPAKVLVAIITDGQENSSHEFFQWQIADLVREQQSKYSWKFVFIGANQDAVLTAAKFNIDRNSAITYTANNVSGVMAQSLNSYTKAVRGATGQSMLAAAGTFTDEERCAATAA
jgi:hypothetical protein